MTVYDPHFYDAIRAGTQRSAEIVVPLMLEALDGHPGRVVDIGGGEGHWGRQFADHGADVLCVDGDYVSDPVVAFEAADLAQPLPDLGEFDLAVCLEVAEHLPPERGETLVAELCALAPTVLFSAAVPGQSGNGHVNCRWPTYWAALFAGHGFGVSDALRWRIWDDEAVEPWYRQNVLIATRGGEGGTIRNVVHPVIWGWFRQ